MSDKKPYGMAAMPKEALGVSGITAEVIEKLKKTGDLKVALRNVINEKIEEYPVPEFAIPKIREAIESAISKEIGNLRIVAKDAPVYGVIKSALKKYNATYPTEQLEMPSLVLEGNVDGVRFGVKYSSVDAMIIDVASNKLSSEELEAVFIHEFKHKSQFLSPETKFPVYNAKAHADSVAPTVFSECKKSGLSDEDIRLLLPSDVDAEKFLTIAIPDPKQQYYMSKIIDGAEWVQHPISRLLASIKATSANKECSNALDKINDTQEGAFNKIRYDYLEQSRNREIDADATTIRAGVAPAMCNALKKMHTVGTIRIGNSESAIMIRDDKDIEDRLDHPVLDTRLQALGCPLPDNNKGQKR